MPNDQAKESQITKLRIKSTEKPSFIIVFQQKSCRKSQKGVSLHRKKSQKGVSLYRKKSQKGVKWRRYETKNISATP